MGRKKLTKILLSSACNPELINHQRETPLDISLRKGFTEVTQVIRNPPKILTPIQRDEMRASKYKGTTGSGSHSKPNPPPAEPGPSSGRGKGSRRLIKSVVQVHTEDKPDSRSKEKRSCNNSSKTGSKNASTGNLKEVVSLKGQSSPGSRGQGKGQDLSLVPMEEVPKWSPYGCHYHPNPGAFPPPNIDSLPTEPLTTGELYYLDLAGNIHKVRGYHFTISSPLDCHQ
jgi:hypothetical protein